MNQDSFIPTFHCYLIGDSTSGQVATRSVGGVPIIVLFTDLALAEDYVRATSELKPGFSPIAISEPELRRQLQAIYATHRRIMVDYNHKTRHGRVFEVDAFIDGLAGE